MSPSSRPSLAFCSVEEFLGKPYFVPYDNTCVRIQLFEGGTISTDNTDPNCASDEFVDTSGPLSEFDEVSDNVVIFSGGIIGDTISIRIRPDEQTDGIDLIFNLESLEIFLFFESCFAPSVSPSGLPTLLPTDVPTNVPSSEPSIEPTVTSSPSSLPSIAPSALCESQSFIGSTVQVPNELGCIQIELFPTGEMKIDATRPECVGASFNGRSVAIFDDFDDSTSVATFTPGEVGAFGTLLIVTKPNLEVPEIEVEVTGFTFDGILRLTEC